MKVLITGACGFVGSRLARRLAESGRGFELYGLDSFMRPGSETNREDLQALGVRLFHGDIRFRSDFRPLPAVDWVIDAAANPSVLAGVDGKTGSLQLVEHNLFGTVNMLEYCKSHGAGFILLSTSRVYSIKALRALEVEVRGGAFCLKAGAPLPPGVSATGIAEGFCTVPPVSLYGSTKLASEALALEYGQAFGFPVFVNRCGVLAGAGQFGRADQGIFSFWINAYRQRLPLRYIGFGGFGYQVRDCLHPGDLAELLIRQMASPGEDTRVVNVGGGPENSISLAGLSEWCASRFPRHEVLGDPGPRAFDVPWMVMDNSLARRVWDFKPRTPILRVLEEIAEHAERNPNWLEISGAL